MPGMKMHHVFGANLVTAKAFDPDEDFINRHPNCFYMGLQGPDLFFYSVSAYVLYEENIGSTMHNANVAAFFHALLSSRDEICNTDEGRAIADAYIAGFMGHYTLDCTCHPYVYYRTKHLTHEGRGAYDFGMHVALETEMDNAFLTHFLDIDPFSYHMEDNLVLTSAEKKVIANLLHRAIHKAYPKKRISYLQTYRSLFQIKLSAKLLLDPKGIKKLLVRRLEEHLFGYSIISGMITARNAIKYPDPCNENHKMWCNPWDPERTMHSESLYDLAKTAEQTLLKRIRMYTDLMYADLTVSPEKKEKMFLDLLFELGDRSYTTGYPLK